MTRFDDAEDCRDTGFVETAFANSGSPDRPMRCQKCFYVLNGLDGPCCPECGTPFDPRDAATFTRKSPFVWWRFWLPGFLVSVVGGSVLYAILIPFFGYGFVTTLVVPFAIGGFIGYGSNTSAPGAFVLGPTAALLCILVLFGGGMLGGACGLVLAGLVIVPAAVGSVIGWILRRSLEKSNFSQRDWLRDRVIQLLILILPIAGAIVEGRHDHMPPVTIVTSRDLHAGAWAVWNSIQFYEQVKGPAPWPLWISPELRPRYTFGKSDKPGDVRVCVYEHGQLKKLTRAVAAPNLLTFDVVQQHEVENRSIMLLDGSFHVSGTDNAKLTHLELRTRYVPLLYPRWAFAWSERYFVHALHNYVMSGMQEQAEASERTVPTLTSSLR